MWVPVPPRASWTSWAAWKNCWAAPSNGAPTSRAPATSATRGPTPGARGGCSAGRRGRPSPAASRRRGRGTGSRPGSLRRPAGGRVPSARRIMVGSVPVGGGAPVAVQSMTCTKTGDAAATLAQVRALVAAGCELVRVSLPTAAEAPAFAHLVREAPAPIIADIHYDWRLAVAAIEAGAAGIRINPGTMAEKHVREIVRVAAEAAVAIRIGVNAGSLPRDLRGRAEREPAAALVEAALRWAARFDEWDFRAYKLSVKSSSVPVTLEAYRLLAARSDAPLHVGVTEAGTVWSGTIKSAVGIGALLAEGIGDTLRVSLTGDPVEEVRVAWKILAALNLRRRGPEVISCPTCGRAPRWTSWGWPR